MTPVIKLDGKGINSVYSHFMVLTFYFLFPPDLIVAESMEDLVSSSSPISESRTYSPGPVLTPDELRKMSLLSSLSVTIPLGVVSVGQDIYFQRRVSRSRNTLLIH